MERNLWFILLLKVSPLELFLPSPSSWTIAVAQACEPDPLHALSFFGSVSYPGIWATIPVPGAAAKKWSRKRPPKKKNRLGAAMRQEGLSGTEETPGERLRPFHPSHRCA